MILSTNLLYHVSSCLCVVMWSCIGASISMYTSAFASASSCGFGFSLSSMSRSMSLVAVYPRFIVEPNRYTLAWGHRLCIISLTFLATSMGFPSCFSVFLLDSMYMSNLVDCRFKHLPCEPQHFFDLYFLISSR